MIDIIAFDADDTLWHNEHFYSDAKRRFIQLLLPYQSAESIERRLDEIEIHNVRYYGYGIKSFVLSMVEAAIELSNGRITGHEIQPIVAIAREMLVFNVPLFEHAQATLAELSTKYALMLITKGDTFEQERKIASTGLAGYFKYIEVVGDKTVKTYQALIGKYNLDPSRFLMVGNSIRSDILPVLEIGGQAVYIPYENTWSHETISEPALKPPAYAQLEHLGQLPALVEKLDQRDF